MQNTNITVFSSSYNEEPTNSDPTAEVQFRKHLSTLQSSAIGLLRV